MIAKIKHVTHLMRQVSQRKQVKQFRFMLVVHCQLSIICLSNSVQPVVGKCGKVRNKTKQNDDASS